MKTKIIFALAIMAQLSLSAQWVDIYYDSTVGLRALDCINEDTVYVAGYNSEFLRTYDKGLTWQSIEPSFEIYTLDINFPDPQTGFMVGVTGKIGKTSDYGDTWILMIPDSNYKLEKVEFIQPDTGWIIGNDMIPGYAGSLILRTFNGGESWDRYYLDDYELCDIEMINASIGFIGLSTLGVMGDYGFLKTEDGGDTWVFTNPGMNHITNISFINDDIGYVLGTLGIYGGLLKTIDGGENWSLIVEDIGGYTYNNLQFLDEQIGYYAGSEAMFNQGMILRTDNGGYLWEEQIVDYFFGHRNDK